MLGNDSSGILPQLLISGHQPYTFVRRTLCSPRPHPHPSIADFRSFPKTSVQIDFSSRSCIATGARHGSYTHYTPPSPSDAYTLMHPLGSREPNSGPPINSGPPRFSSSSRTLKGKRREETRNGNQLVVRVSSLLFPFRARQDRDFWGVRT